MGSQIKFTFVAGFFCTCLVAWSVISLYKVFNVTSIPKDQGSVLDLISATVGIMAMMLALASGFLVVWLQEKLSHFTEVRQDVVHLQTVQARQIRLLIDLFTAARTCIELDSDLIIESMSSSRDKVVFEERDLRFSAQFRNSKFEKLHYELMLFSSVHTQSTYQAITQRLGDEDTIRLLVTMRDLFPDRRHEIDAMIAAIVERLRLK